MEKILELLNQRRVWAAIVSTLVFILGVFSISLPDQATLIDILTQIGSAIATLIPGILALLSYFRPKK
jgi:protein-S-isoprenylcysteine O-methyltransferase Ste14